MRERARREPPGTNSLLDIVVFGRRGGAHAAGFCEDADLPELPERPEGAVRDMVDGLLNRPEGANAADIRGELQDSMQELAFVVRTEESLRKMQEILGACASGSSASTCRTRARCSTPS